MSSDWTKVNSQLNTTAFLIGRQLCEFWNTQGKCQVIMKTNIQIIHPYTPKNTEDCKQTTRIWKKARKDSSTGFKGNMALPKSWFQTSNFQNYDTIHVCCSNPPSLWSWGQPWKTDTAKSGNGGAYGKTSSKVKAYFFMLASAKNISLNWE